ncbi:ribonuclease H-like domain-containing protein [Rhizophagus clarus]|uniref:Ribonuclease H-like domain-containing protein n=1 Tax=Rhizophagus clarus TaxID=94130 RepID=A0A8H3LWA5_9GLOM|nr:ribonuclease H-like domain-containing protein [Rhizophagus clarus]
MITNRHKGGHLRRDVSALQKHIANYCPNALPYLICKYQKIFEKKANKNNKKRRVSNQTSLHDYYDTDESFPQKKIDRINRVLLTFFVCCEISFCVVESLFFINFINELNIAYNSLSCELLVNRLFEDELGNINSKIYKKLQMSDNLMLALDG